MKKIMYLLLSTGLVLLLTACGESEIESVDSDAESNDTESEEPAETEDTDDDEAGEDGEDTSDNDTQNLAIGDSVNFNGLIITLNEARIEPGGEWDEPSEGQFVVVNLTAENTTDEEESVSSMMNITFKDDESYTYNTTILTEGTKGQFDGSIEPGGSLRGEIPFDVPESGNYELHYSNPFQSGKAIWKIPSDQLTQ